MVSSEMHIEISRPIADVWGFMTKIANLTLWQSGVARVSATDEMRVGSILNLSTIALGREFELVATVTDNDGKSTFAAQSIQGPITFKTRYTLSDFEGGTRVLFSNHINTHALFRLAEGALKSVSDIQYEADLATLKGLLERVVAPSEA